MDGGVVFFKHFTWTKNEENFLGKVDTVLKK
jgi:hypothetical protein